MRATEVVYARIAILDAIGATGEDGLKGTEVFEGNVSDGRCSFHGKRGHYNLVNRRCYALGSEVICIRFSTHKFWLSE
jgi:hypothetical protein